ncbi:MAG: hypothetical protein ACOYI7_03425 [Candidatus Excrementavichristensenella sp.]
MLKPWKTDVPIVINFFVRPAIFEKTFECIRNARPRVLFLISDGPRENSPSDVENIRRCREIVEDRDWECEVYKIYNETNKGLFDTYFDSMKQVFQIVDRCIFLEDDLIAAQSFFPYCAYLLEKYENDLRVHYISGVNYMGEYDEPDGDYFFCGEGAITGYAIWKRTFDSMNFAFRENKYAIRCSIDVAKQLKPGYEKRIKKTVNDPMWEGHIPHVEFFKNLLRFTENQIYIVPCKNQISHIGVGDGSMHNPGTLKKIPAGWRQIHFQPVYEIDMPMKDPEFCVRDLKYERYVNKVLAWNSPIRCGWRKMVSLLRAIQYGDFSRIIYKFIHIFKKDSKR